MPRLNDRYLYQLEWFTRNAFAGISNCLHGREAAAEPLETQLIQNLVIDLLDAQRHDCDFRHSEVLGFTLFANHVCAIVLPRSCKIFGCSTCSIANATGIL